MLGTEKLVAAIKLLPDEVAVEFLDECRPTGTTHSTAIPNSLPPKVLRKNGATKLTRRGPNVYAGIVRKSDRWLAPLEILNAARDKGHAPSLAMTDEEGIAEVEKLRKYCGISGGFCRDEQGRFWTQEKAHKWRHQTNEDNDEEE